jgi:hypothetical protein
MVMKLGLEEEKTKSRNFLLFELYVYIFRLVTLYFKEDHIT